MAIRQSPISSRKRSTTTVRSVGSTPVASRCSSMYATRLRAAHSSRWYRRRSVSTARSVSIAPMVRTKRPIALPVSTGRPTRSPFQNGIRPDSAGAGITSTRSAVMSLIRHAEVPRTNTSPGRDS